MKFTIFEIVLYMLGGCLVLFVAAPLISMCISTSFPAFYNVLTDGEVQKSIWLTVFLSILGTLIFSIFAIPLAYILARKNFFGKRIISGLIDLPIVIPHSAAGIALLGVFSRTAIGGKILGEFGLSFVDSKIGIIAAMAFVSLPYLINAARNGFESVPIKLEQTSYSLGASNTRTFFAISLPLAKRHIMSGFVLMWARGLSEFGAVVIIAYYPMTTPVMIYDKFTTFGLKSAQPLALLFIIVCLIIFVLFRVLSKNIKTTFRG